ncbi:hypothetical protein ACQKWADRAFT_286711 [Trichoderma austrokoningii]
MPCIAQAPYVSFHKLKQAGYIIIYSFLQSQAIKTPAAIYCSGQVHLTNDGVLIDGSIAEKTRNAVKTLKQF